jgi:hypothetical protein
MPIALDTNEIFRYVFSTDRGRDKPPTLLFRYPTARQTREIANLFDQSDKAATPDESLALMEKAVKVILAGSENMPAGEPGDYLSDTDFSELRGRLLKEMSANELEKKVSAFSRLSTLENSAKSATVDAPATK